MNNLEKNAVRIVAKLSPWLAPFPSAWFVGRSAMSHLDLPLPVAMVVAAIIETLGLATVHTALWSYDWNSSKRKSDPKAPVVLAVALGGVYVTATLGLVVFLEVWPMLSTYAPALFPALAVVGAVNLALISQQERREGLVLEQKAERQAIREGRCQTRRQVSHVTTFDGTLDALLSARRAKRKARVDALLAFYASYPDGGATQAARAVGVSRQTVYTYLAELQAAGQVDRSNGTVTVLQGV